MNAKRTRNYYDMFAIMFNSQKSYQKYIENTHLGLLTETHEYYFGSLKHQIFIYSRWRHPPKTISPRPYCRSRRGRNGLGSETSRLQEVAIAFSPWQNGAKILSTSVRGGDSFLGMLNGMRVLSMWWVIFGHSVLFQMAYLSKCSFMQ